MKFIKSKNLCRTITTLLALIFSSVVLGIVFGKLVDYPDPTKSDVPFWVFASLSATIGVFLAIVFTAFIFRLQNFLTGFNDLVRDYRNELNEMLPGRGGHFELGDIRAIIEGSAPDEMDKTGIVKPIYADFKFLLDEHEWSSNILRTATYRLFGLMGIVLLSLPLGEAPLQIRSNLLLFIWWAWLYFPVLSTLYIVGDLISRLHSYTDF